MPNIVILASPTHLSFFLYPLCLRGEICFSQACLCTVPPSIDDHLQCIYNGRAQKPSATFVGENVAWENATVSWVLKSER